MQQAYEKTRERKTTKAESEGGTDDKNRKKSAKHRKQKSVWLLRTVVKHCQHPWLGRVDVNRFDAVTARAQLPLDIKPEWLFTRGKRRDVKHERPVV